MVKSGKTHKAKGKKGKGKKAAGGEPSGDAKQRNPRCVCEAGHYREAEMRRGGDACMRARRLRRRLGARAWSALQAHTRAHARMHACAVLSPAHLRGIERRGLAAYASMQACSSMHGGPSWARGSGRRAGRGSRQASTSMN